MANVICLDFDDTIVMANTARQLFERFAAPEWRDREAEYHAGRLSVEQFNQRALDLIDAERDDLVAFVQAAAEVRPGFVELVDWGHWNGWLCVVVSNGFDFYVDAVLDGLGLDRVARHAGRARKEYRWRASYLSPRGIEVEDGFKLSYAAAFQSAGDFVAYVGDGASDVPAAKLSQVVFARDTLLERLKGTRERVYAFETFHDVVGIVDREAEAWLASFSSTTAAAD